VNSVSSACFTSTVYIRSSPFDSLFAGAAKSMRADAPASLRRLIRQAFGQRAGTYPRDELFQINKNTPNHFARSILSPSCSSKAPSGCAYWRAAPLHRLVSCVGLCARASATKRGRVPLARSASTLPRFPRAQRHGLNHPLQSKIAPSHPRCVPFISTDVGREHEVYPYYLALLYPTGHTGETVPQPCKGSNKS